MKKTLITLALIMLFAACSDDSEVYDEFAFSKEECEKIIAENINATENIDNRKKGYQIEPGPPFRAVFVYKRGMIDNWQGLVYDPSKEIDKIIGYSVGWETWWNDPKLESIKKMFYGDVKACEKFEDWGNDWYLCYFT